MPFLMEENNKDTSVRFDAASVRINLFERVALSSFPGQTVNDKIDEFQKCVDGGSEITLDEFLRLGARYIHQLDEISNTDDKKLRSALKKKNLPAATISALLKSRSSNLALKDKIIHYNGIVVLDFDDVHNLEDAKKKVAALPYVWYVGLSASKRGFYAIIPTDNDDYLKHTMYFVALSREMLDLGLRVDANCCDVTRLRFVSFDPNPLYNYNCVPYSLPKDFDTETFAPAVSSASSMTMNAKLSKVMAYVNEWTKRKLCLDNHNDWFMMGMALSELGEEGWNILSQMAGPSSHYNDKNHRKQYDWFMSHDRNVSLGTFFYKCHEYGVVPQGDNSYPIVPFPTEVFPEQVQIIVKETHNCLNFNTDHIASCLLFVASVAIGNSVTVEIKNEWVDKAILYMAIVGKPGTNKSAPLKYALRPLVERDGIELEKYEALREKFEEAVRNANRTRTALPEEPVYKQIVLSDFTTEVLMRQHKINPRGLTVYVDELIGFIKNFNKYRSGNDEQVWTQMFNGGSVIVNRMSSQPLNIKETFVGVIGTIQPGLLPEFAKGKTESGFLDRWLFSYPDESVYPKFNDDELPKEITSCWQKIVNDIFKINYVPDGKTYRLNDEARAIYSEWFNAIADQKNSSSAMFAELSTKMERYCIRFAIVLEALDCVCSGRKMKEITGKSIKGGIDLCYYFTGCAIKARKKFERNPVDELTERQKRIYFDLPISFSTSEGLEVALANDVSERGFKEWLKSDFFRHVSHGQYEKRYK